MPSTARDWMLTISAEKHTRQDVEELLDILGAYIFQQEEGGKSDYPHFQAFLQLQTPVHMGTLTNKFKKAGFNLSLIHICGDVRLRGAERWLTGRGHRPRPWPRVRDRPGRCVR